MTLQVHLGRVSLGDAAVSCRFSCEPGCRFRAWALKLRRGFIPPRTSPGLPPTRESATSMSACLGQSFPARESMRDCEKKQKTHPNVSYVGLGVGCRDGCGDFQLRTLGQVYIRDREKRCHHAYVLKNACILETSCFLKGSVAQGHIIRSRKFHISDLLRVWHHPSGLTSYKERNMHPSKDEVDSILQNPTLAPLKAVLVALLQL